MVFIRTLAFFLIVWYGVSYLFKKLFYNPNNVKNEEDEVILRHTQEHKNAQHKEKVGEYVDYEEIED